MPSQDLGYQIFATMSTFYVPLVIILLLYWKIFMTARTRLRKRLAAKAQVDLSTNGAGKLYRRVQKFTQNLLQQFISPLLDVI